MMIPEPSPISAAMLTFWPGLPSASSTVGMESPTLTMIAICVFGIERWIVLRCEADGLKSGSRVE